METQEQHQWEAYCNRTIQEVTPLLQKLGYELEKNQVHTRGERYLTTAMRDVGGGGFKLVLLGVRSTDRLRVVIKVSDDAQGIAEMERERTCREALHTINFATRPFLTPKELHHELLDSYLISITEYVFQEKAFLEHSLEEQFFLILRAFETQEGVHATTHEHARMIEDVFGMVTASDYLSSFETYTTRVAHALPDRLDLAEAMVRAEAHMKEHRTTIERYCGFLTHADFVPNNFRVAHNDIYLLDCASIHFGNKYESWARFLNFMIHHNSALEHVLMEYVRSNRSEDEYLSLRLMRMYKIGFLLAFYAEAFHKTSGDLRTTMEHRLVLWRDALLAVIEDRVVSEETITHYLLHVEALRSPEEKARQRELLGKELSGK